ncbi:CHASE2 domain-containing protein [Pantanalinema sp. GBBB05]|uniref:CHASE2 domain-containing protein n=1 Tax=Pantanalinema sp. GBBB05 TaxID=2604139 RepID=UPI001D986292|nr:adenylate/guanylate cyclase domain-containing protein [Pantanalinema sp. GBBB05]
MGKQVSWVQQLWRSQRRSRLYTDWQPLLVIGVLLTGSLLALRQAGVLQPLELAAYDQLLRLRPDRPSDSRILVVEITQQDNEAMPNRVVNDAEFANLLSTLQQHQPVVIGVDVLLEPTFPPGTAELHTQMRRPNVIAITSLGNNAIERTSPPKYLPTHQIAFSDIPIDGDGLVRRSTLVPIDPQLTYPSLSHQLVAAYLAANCPGYRPRKVDVVCRDITFHQSPQGEFYLGAVRLPKLQPDAGGYQGLDNRGYQFLIDYRAAQSPTLQVTLSQLRRGEVNPEWIHNKIVLIGNSSPINNDLFYTPYSAIATGHRQMPGVVLHAQMVSQLLSVGLDGQPLFWFWPEWAEFLWITAWAIAGVGVAWTFHKPRRVLLGGIGLLVLLVGSSFLLFLSHGWVPVVTPAIACMLTGIATVTYKQYRAQQQHQVVMRLLGQQTSPEIANTLWEGRHYLITSGRLPWQNVTATLLFSDLKGFSTLSEQQPPEVVMGWLNQYLAVMSDEVQAHHGIVNKFLGDGIMAVFGVPIARTDATAIAADAHNAVACALAMRQRLMELNQLWQHQGATALQMRIGIFTGSVMVGSLGGKTRLEYGVIGDSVNTASRLESCEKERQMEDCRILIAQETLDYVQSAFIVEPWGQLTLKGKHQPVIVYRVIDIAGS